MTKHHFLSNALIVVFFAMGLNVAQSQEAEKNAGQLVTSTAGAPKLGSRLKRVGDEVVVCGQLFHTTAKVILWTDPGGYDAYRVERRFSPFDQSSWERSKELVSSLDSPNRYGLRKDALSNEQIVAVRGGGWSLPALQKKVDQFVLHYDVCGTSRKCFEVLHDMRGLSVHFMLDIDGTIYQTLDLKERAWHATTSNTRSIGIEIANIGAYPPKEARALNQWYVPDGSGKTRIMLPTERGDGGVATPGFIGRPARNELVSGTVQNTRLVQYDFTEQQYQSLAKLTATLCTIFPRIKCDYPRDESGEVVPEKLDDDSLATFEGILGHYHIQTNKTDPGPAFQWERLVKDARALMPQSEN